jgi:putative heme-binding domain-containing protein
MKLTRSLLSAMLACVFAISLLYCGKEKPLALNAYRDTTIRVHGPYLAVKLPINKGVKMGNPIQLSLGPRGLLFASNQTGEVYTLHDSDGDGFEDSTALYCDVGDLGLRSPVGFANKGDTVYVGTAQQVRIFLDTDNDAKADTSWTFHDEIPQSEHPYEWISGLSFGSDGWLYCAITTDSWNAAPAADPKGLRGAIIRISPNGRVAERLATGIRSVPGMAFNKHGDLFFIDNEGGGNPTEELNRLRPNSFYGHNKRKYASDSSKVTLPEFNLQSDVAPSSIEFNSSSNDFGGSAGDLFVSYYGPGERWTRGSIGRVVVNRQADGTYAYNEYTIAEIPKLSDLAFGKDGNLYLAHHGRADYWYNAVYPEEGGFYKLIYDPTINIPANYVKPKEAMIFEESATETGKQLFAELGCLGCHQVDGTTELLGPNLKDVAKNFTRAEILEEILKPSARIKPSMGGVRLTKNDGNVLYGRVVNSDEKNLSFMLVGNQVVSVARSEIAKMENEKKSLMFEGLADRLPDDKRNALLDYLVSLSQDSR